MIMQHSIIPGEITEFVMEGTCDVDEVLSVVKSEYNAISKGILWNLSAGSIFNLSPDDMRHIANVVKEHAVHKKTAYFGSIDLEFGLLRMYEAYAKMECVPPVMKVFRDRNEAIEWLKE
jgi:hypothetical protein